MCPGRISRTGLAVSVGGTTIRTVKLLCCSVLGVRVFFVVCRREVGACAVRTGCIWGYVYGRSISRTGLAVRSAVRAVRTVSLEFNNLRGVRVFFVVYRKEVGDGAVCTGAVPYRTAAE